MSAGTRWDQIKTTDRLGTGPKGQSVDQTLTGVTVAAYAVDGFTLTTGVIPISTVGSGTAIGTWVTGETPVGILDGVNATFAIAHTPIQGTETVFLNGVRQDPNRWVTINGLAITFEIPPISIDFITVNYEY